MTTEGPTFDTETLAGISGLDAQIDTLLKCKPLPEIEIRQLCDKVSQRELQHQALRRANCSNAYFKKSLYWLLEVRNGGVTHGRSI